MDYQIYPHLRAVPMAWFNDEEVVVEKFLPEFKDGLYHVWNLSFLGDRMSCVRFASQNPIVNVSTPRDTEKSKPHPEIVKLLGEMKIDYGELDYVVRDDGVFLLDLNKTMGVGSMQVTPQLQDTWEYRAKGLYSYFGRTA